MACQFLGAMESLDTADRVNIGGKVGHDVGVNPAGRG